MEKTATLSLRVSPDVKEDAESILKKLGIPMSVAIDMYLKQIVYAGGFRFERWLANRRAAVLAISHDLAFVSRIFSRVWHLREGRLENSFSRAPGGDT